MRRTFWFAAGAGVSVYAMNRVNRLREAATVDGLKDRLSALGLGARMLREDIAQGQAEKETELRDRLGLTPHGIPELDSGPSTTTASPTPIEITKDKEGTD